MQFLFCATILFYSDAVCTLFQPIFRIKMTVVKYFFRVIVLYYYDGLYKRDVNCFKNIVVGISFHG